MKKNQSYFLPIFMCFGMALGISAGQVFFDNISAGMTFGLILGVMIGIALDSIKRK